jgi:hypothetical protein
MRVERAYRRKGGRAGAGSLCRPTHMSHRVIFWPQDGERSYWPPVGRKALLATSWPKGCMINATQRRLAYTCSFSRHISPWPLPSFLVAFSLILPPFLSVFSIKAGVDIVCYTSAHTFSLPSCSPSMMRGSTRRGRLAGSTIHKTIQRALL